MPETDEAGTWFEDHLIDKAGKRWGLLCGWRAGSDLTTPACLIITEEQRRAAWVGHRYTDPYRGGNVEDWRLREEANRERIAEVERQKRTDKLEKFRAEHEGERWDRKRKLWVKKKVKVDVQPIKREPGFQRCISCGKPVPVGEITCPQGCGGKEEEVL